jgi:hypothetical protein
VCARSKFRPVPDNQEVFVDVDTDQSLVVEVLEHEAEVADGPAAATFMFTSLAHDNDAEDGAVVDSAQELTLPLDMPTLYQVPCAVCRVPCAVCRVPCAVCRVPCAVCCVPCAVCRVPCAVCSVQCRR